jgi:hypothetical protein
MAQIETTNITIKYNTPFGCRYSTLEFGIGIYKLQLQLFGCFRIQNWNSASMPTRVLASTLSQYRGIPHRIGQNCPCLLPKQAQLFRARHLDPRGLRCRGPARARRCRRARCHPAHACRRRALPFFLTASASSLLPHGRRPGTNSHLPHGRGPFRSSSQQATWRPSPSSSRHPFPSSSMGGCFSTAARRVAGPLLRPSVGSPLPHPCAIPSLCQPTPPPLQRVVQCFAGGPAPLPARDVPALPL